MSGVSGMTGVSKDELISMSKDDLLKMIIKKDNISYLRESSKPGFRTHRYG